MQGAAVPQSARLLELQEKAGKLRSELAELESNIDFEERLLLQASTDGASTEVPAPLLFHRPSYSLLAGAEADASPSRQTIRKLSVKDEDFDSVLKSHPELKVEPIGKYNHWDRRECAVPEENAALWRAKCAEHVKSHGGNCIIPKVIHQIWIGPREPPCLWIDTFRVEYLAEHPEWGFELWGDERVATLPMINEQIYTEEKMWQCKADILRLEFLWHYGGVYVDADMISVETKDLAPIVDLGKDTGFVIAFEPDTKDKPYSILGNSVIACTPHHPLTLMLILFLKHTFYHKRNVIDVFAVTGPVMYTKCLVDCKMPISVAAQELLYPAFHYVPNPDVINFSQFPKCLMFQFGYTCSGLEGYVKSKNRCKKARECPFHSKKDWPLGGFAPLPSPEEVAKSFDAAGRPGIPKVIHQLVYGGLDGEQDPTRWRRVWWDDFKRDHPEFQYRTWTKQQLLGRKWLCANLYVEPLDDHAVTELMLEVLFQEGGYYVPLTTMYKAGQGRDPFFGGAEDFAEGFGGVMGAAKGSPGCFKKMMALYDSGHIGAMALSPEGSAGPRVTAMGFRDGSAAKAQFKPDTKYMGAAQLVSFSMGAGDARLQSFLLGWAYEGMVPCLQAKGPEGMAALLAEGVLSKAVFVTDREFMPMHNLRSELPGLIDRLPSGWDVMLFGLEWNTGFEEVVLFNVPPGGRPRNCIIAGFVVNFVNNPHAAEMRKVLQACVTATGFDPAPLFDAAGRLSLWFGAEKYAGSIEEARIWRALPTVSRAFQQFADHHPPMENDRQELHGNLMKGWKDGHLRFEVIAEPNGGIMYRAWNDDNSTNCEMKSNGTAVEWMKVYYNHQVAKEVQNKPL